VVVVTAGFEVVVCTVVVVAGFEVVVCTVVVGAEAPGTH